MPPRAHAHGAPAEEEVIIVRTDGPPFIGTSGSFPCGIVFYLKAIDVDGTASPMHSTPADLKAKQGQGFDVDFNKVQAHLGPGKITHSDFARDIDLINKQYIPTAHKSYQYLRAGTWMLMVTFFVLILVRSRLGLTNLTSGCAAPESPYTFSCVDRYCWIF